MMNPHDVDTRIAELWEGIPEATGTARADLLMELADHLMEAERHSEALPVLETAEELFVEAGVDWLVGRAAHNRGVVLGRLGRPDEQLEAEYESISAYERGQRQDLSGCSRMALGIHLRAAGRLKEAAAAFRAAVEDFSASDEMEHRGHAMVAVLEAEIDLGRLAPAERLLQPTLAVVAATAPVPVVASVHLLAAQVLEARRGPAAALHALRNARAVWDALGDDDSVATCDIRTAVLTIDTEGPKAAVKLLRDLRPERQLAGDVAGVAACDRGLGLAALARHRPQQALRYLDIAATVFQACALFADAAECESLAGSALAQLGRTSEAIDQLRRVAPTLATLDRPLAEMAARLTLADLLVSEGDPRRAAKEAKRAASIARRAQLADDLARARALAAGASRQPVGEPEQRHAAG